MPGAVIRAVSGRNSDAGHGANLIRPLVPGCGAVTAFGATAVVIALGWMRRSTLGRMVGAALDGLASG